MKVVLTVFAPMLVAIAIRLALFLVALLIFVIFSFILGTQHGIMIDIADCLWEFNPFILEESWGYWILVVIGSFLAEMAIWADD